MKTYKLSNGIFVGTQAEIPKGDNFTTVEVPTSKNELIEFINELQSQQVTPIPVDDSPPPSKVTVPQSTEEEQTYARFRADVAEGRVLLDEYILAAPLNVSLRLLQLVAERVREHHSKAKSSPSLGSAQQSDIEDFQ